MQLSELLSVMASVEEDDMPAAAPSEGLPATGPGRSPGLNPLRRVAEIFRAPAGLFQVRPCRTIALAM